MRSSTRKLKELVIFAVLGSILFVSHIAMMWIPNVHLIGLFIAAFTLTYRVRALIPVYVYVIVYGAFFGFAPWWIPYLYIWLPIWGMFMLAGRLQLSIKVKIPLYMLLCAFRIVLRNSVRTCSGMDIRLKLSRHDCMDNRWDSV